MNISLVEEKSLQSNLSFNKSNFNNNSATTGLVFIDSKVDDYAILMRGITKNLEVVLLDDNCNGIAQITQALKGRFNLSSLHIVAHGEPGKLWLGNGFINSNTLEQYSDHLQSWGAALAPDADILLYGCNVAAGETGQQFVQLLSQLTGTDVAASNNLTGSAALGGDWELDVKIGLVEAPIAFGAETLEAYSAILTTRRVSVDTNGTQGNGSSASPSISADGRYVTFYSNASNLVSGDTNNAPDIFVYDTVANTTRRVSVDSNGTQGNNTSTSPSISADGSRVAFYSEASNLVSGDTNGYADIFVSNNPLAPKISSPDFNSDGKADILWRNGATGQNIVWLMDGTNLTTGVALTPVADVNWDISGTGDFNGDGKEDILWRDSITGQNIVWLMDGTNLTTGVALTPVADVNWDISGTGDFNGDGKEDILWRNQATGQNIVWLMDGTNITTGVALTPVADANWSICCTADYNHNGKEDILWRNGATGQNFAWLMNGTELATGVALTPVADSNWQIVA